MTTNKRRVSKLEANSASRQPEPVPEIWLGAMGTGRSILWLWWDDEARRYRPGHEHPTKAHLAACPENAT